MNWLKNFSMLDVNPRRSAGSFFLIIIFLKNQNLYILKVTISIFMVTNGTQRGDTAIRVSRWLDEEIEGYISDKKKKVAFPSKRNFVDTAVMQLLEKEGVKLNE